MTEVPALLERGMMRHVRSVGKHLNGWLTSSPYRQYIQVDLVLAAMISAVLLSSCGKLEAPKPAEPPPPVLISEAPTDVAKPSAESEAKQAKSTSWPKVYDKPSSTVTNVNYKVVKVFFGTDRRPVSNSDSPRDTFGEERGHGITYGDCEVSIPRDHKTGALEAPFILRKYLENPEKHIVLLRIKLRKEGEFWSDIGTARATAKKNEALIFIHGFNNTFEDAARRTAQIAHDIEFGGIPMFYSWPSGGATRDYISDGNNADQAVAYLKVFLRNIATNSKFDSVTLLAHSMGNRALTAAFLSLKAELPPKQMKIFKEIILAAPDIDADYFRNNIGPALIATKTATTLYASSNDEALIASKKVNGHARAGDSGAGLIVLSGIETIDATNVDTNLFWGLRHGYVADDRNVLSDLHYLVEKRLRADSRYGLSVAPGSADPQYWMFKP